MGKCLLTIPSNNTAIYYFRQMAKLPLDILHEDEHIIAISKPSGMLTLPDRHDEELQSLRGILERFYGRIFVVHRLDKDTSGVIVFAKDEHTHKYLSKLFESRDGISFIDSRILHNGESAIRAASPDMILVSALKHYVDLITEDGFEENDFTGINYMRIGLDFVVG